jgi:Mn2+/Fe2+ NRAMP family transporter
MVLITVTQLGAMIGGVAQALHLAFPSVANLLARLAPTKAWQVWLIGVDGVGGHPEHPWAVLTAMVAILLLVSGGYRRVETIATVLVVTITAMTVSGVVAIQWTDYAIRPAELAQGFSSGVFQLSGAAIAAAFGCFGITGVGASELYAYPYWCLEKGYARFAGQREESAIWVQRALGWIRVMKLDAWVSMLVFTAATVSFYFMGAAVLHKEGLDPKGPEMVRTLSEMYQRTFGDWTRNVFLLGASAVLFKTLYVASAGHSRLTADVLALAGITHYERAEDRAVWIRRFGAFYPGLGLLLYFVFREPTAMVVIGGFIQAITLPLLSCTTLYLRYRRLDRRIGPSWFADICLWLAVVLISLVAGYAVWDLVRNTILPLLG